MTKIFYDTEFIDDGHTIDLISIGMVADTGDEYYAVSNEFNMSKFARNPWLVENVWPSLPQIRGDARMRILSSGMPGWARPRHWVLRDLFDETAREVESRALIAARVHEFLMSFDDRELWAWYGAYDHVALAQLWGPMANLPHGIPMFTNDLKQEAMRLGNPTVPKQTNGAHNALEDARHNKVIAEFLAGIEARNA